jgi:hypothetical protein
MEDFSINFRMLQFQTEDCSCSQKINEDRQRHYWTKKAESKSEMLSEEKLDEVDLNILLKNVYRLNPHTVDELEENTQREVYCIAQQELQHMNVNCMWICQECVQNNGEHLQHLL